MPGDTRKKGKQQPQQAAPPNPSPFFQVDEALLEEMENANFHFFWEQANPETGIVRDRCNARIRTKAISAASRQQDSD